MGEEEAGALRGRRAQLADDLSGSLAQRRAAIGLPRKVNPGKHVVFFAIGFETTAPSTALTLLRARAEGVKNFSVFCNHVTIIPAIKALLVRDTRLSIVADPDVDGTFRGDLKDVTLRQALEMILQPHGLRHRLIITNRRHFERNSVLRKRRKALIHLFTVQYANP